MHVAHSALAMSVYTKQARSIQCSTKFLQILCVALEAVLLTTPRMQATLATQSLLQGGHSFEYTLTLYCMEIGAKGGGGDGNSFEGGCSFERLRYIGTITGLHFEYREREGGEWLARGNITPP